MTLSERLKAEHATFHPVYRDDINRKALLNEAGEALEMCGEVLRAVEWGSGRSKDRVAICPMCFAFESTGHLPDCRLAAAIRATEGKNK